MGLTVTQDGFALISFLYLLSFLTPPSDFTNALLFGVPWGRITSDPFKYVEK